jgi:hypothetical protein
LKAKLNFCSREFGAYLLRFLYLLPLQKLCHEGFFPEGGIRNAENMREKGISLAWDH